MNQPTPIIVTEYTGREVNPHRKPKYIDLVPYIQSESNKLWLKFERSVKSYPCPSIANTEPGKTILAELKWQFWAPNSLYPEWEDCDPNETWREEWCRGNGCKTRQIWAPIVEQKEGEGKEDSEDFELMQVYLMTKAMKYSQWKEWLAKNKITIAPTP